MNLSINGQSQVPPGFRFHPTEEELLHYYLRKKVASEKIDLDVIREVDLNKLEPWDIQEKCKIGSTPQNDWYFFSHKDKKYPTGTRTNRATFAGFWKATGRDKIIYSGFQRIGLRKTLVFYKGRAPHGVKSDWIMHEYRLDENKNDIIATNSMGDFVGEDGWVICRIFRKKNDQKALENPKSSSSICMESKSIQMLGSGNDAVISQILLYMGGTERISSSNNNNKDDDNENDNNTSITELLQERFMHLPRLDSPSLPSIPINSTPFDRFHQTVDETAVLPEPSGDITKTGLNNNNDWVALDRLVASQLNGGQVETSEQQLFCYGGDPNAFSNISLSPSDDQIQISQLHAQSQRSNQGSQVVVFGNNNDLWSSFTKSSSSPSSSSDPLRHLSV